MYASISEANEFVERDWISLSLGESCGLSPFTGGLPGSFAGLLDTLRREDHEPPRGKAYFQ